MKNSYCLEAIRPYLFLWLTFNVNFSFIDVIKDLRYMIYVNMLFIYTALMRRTWGCPSNEKDPSNPNYSDFWYTDWQAYVLAKCFYATVD